MTVRGKIFAIKRFSLHDGPNLRTTVFFKGCPLHCRWCHNPEGISRQLQTVSSVDRCIGCGECIVHCPQQALSMGSTGIERDVNRCDNCGECVQRCPALVHEQTGRQVTVDEVISEISKDLPFYDQSGGGVTFSGGEPFDQPEFLMALLAACGELSIHRTVDTSAYVSGERLRAALAVTDLMLCDIKHMDSSVHKEYTGVGNERILENIRLLAGSGCDLRIRLPLIPGVNDSLSNIAATIRFIKSLDVVRCVDVLPYHRAAEAKYRKLKSVYPGNNIAEPTDSSLEQVVTLIERQGLEAVVGG
ncbi:MAG: glycyl-radical enzyme activating protein [Desulfocapsaceae bacterium]|nr:glycyl-radical enzyme activating protein [Desulfocapsaceae bacterium]